MVLLAADEEAGPRRVVVGGVIASAVVGILAIVIVVVLVGGCGGGGVATQSVVLVNGQLGELQDRNQLHVRLPEVERDEPQSERLANGQVYKARVLVEDYVVHLVSHDWLLFLAYRSRFFNITSHCHGKK